MIRFYKNKTPQKGEVVVVCISNIDGPNITCSLLEYEGLQGMICRAEVSRNTMKAYKSLEPGKIIPTVCVAVDIKEDKTFIDLQYVSMDKTQVKHYKDRYESILKIINAFTWIAGSSLDKFNDLNHNDYLQNEEIRKIVSDMMDDSIHTLTKDEIIEYFYTNVNKLHSEANNWKYCNTIPNFLNKLFERFPKPVLMISSVISIKTNKFNGLSFIKSNLLKLEECIKLLDNKALIDIKLLKSSEQIPEFKLTINSDIINENTLDTFKDNISKFVSISKLELVNI